VSRTPAQRFAILLVMALHLSAWAGDALGFHPCPHHSAIPGAMHAPMGHAPMEHGHAGHGQGSPAPHAQHEACTCVSACPSAAPALLPTAAPALTAAVTSVPAEPLGAASTILPRFLPHVLPYGHAPPA
jgi:hypothetical protein